MENGNGASNGNGHASGALTYAEVRRMARWLWTFTAQDLADALRISIELADQCVIALLTNDMVDDTGEFLDGPDGAESVYEVQPLPPGPTEHPHQTPPEIMAVIQMGGLLLYDDRGMPVRIRTERQQRGSMSTPGARQKVKNREAAYRRHMEAVERRKQEQQVKAKTKVPKWLREKRARKARQAKHDVSV